MKGAMFAIGPQQTFAVALLKRDIALWTPSSIDVILCAVEGWLLRNNETL
jgi:hypothetical protein